MGQNRDFIPRLAEDAQKLADYHTSIQEQVATAKKFALESGPYHEEGDLKGLENIIDGFADDIGNRIKQLDQTVKDLLQLVGLELGHCQYAHES